MGFIFSIILTLVVLSVLSSILWPSGRQQIDHGPPRLALEERDALPEDRLDEFGDLCVSLTSCALELHSDYDEILDILERNDGLSGIEAADKMRYATTGAQEIFDKSKAVVDEGEWMPEDAQDWLQHAMDVGEELVSLEDEDGQLFQKGGDMDIPIAIMEQAQGKVEVLLLAANDFSRRMLDFNLCEWVDEDLGRDKLKRMKKALKDAEKSLA